MTFQIADPDKSIIEQDPQIDLFSLMVKAAGGKVVLETTEEQSPQFFGSVSWNPESERLVSDLGCASEATPGGPVRGHHRRAQHRHRGVLGARRERQIGKTSTKPVGVKPVRGRICGRAPLRPVTLAEDARVDHRAPSRLRRNGRGAFRLLLPASV
jgi:hypothetical protein